MGQLLKWILSCGDTCGEVMVCFDHYLQAHIVEELNSSMPSSSQVSVVRRDNEGC